MKVAIYARYSSDNQRDASIADQLRVCREFAARQGWIVAQEFTDHAVSGATLLRAGFQALMRDALDRRFDVVLAEALDRFSHDQEDTAGLFKRLTFAGVNIVTLAEGDITHLHIGLAIAAHLQTALVLDDQLVHSDSARLNWFRERLRSSVREHCHQVIVFTCRPGDYLSADAADDDSVAVVDLKAQLAG